MSIITARFGMKYLKELYTKTPTIKLKLFLRFVCLSLKNLLIFIAFNISHLLRRKQNEAW